MAAGVQDLRGKIQAKKESFLHHRWVVLFDVFINCCSSSSVAPVVVGERHNNCCTQDFI